jgi:hypothetical protein
LNNAVPQPAIPCDRAPKGGLSPALSAIEVKTSSTIKILVMQA